MGHTQLDLMQPAVGGLEGEDLESVRQILAAVRFTRSRAAVFGEAPMPVRVIARIVERFIGLLGRTRSPLERAFLALLAEAGLEGRFEAQQPLTVDVAQPNGEVQPVTTTPDFLDRHARLAVFVDGHQYHSTPEAMERDNELSFALTLAGWRVLRVTSSAIRHRPNKVVRQLRQAYLSPSGSG